jgi:mannose/fructose/N-acetylgalactosamine-specific phosphotransferase system component IID
MVLFNGLPLFPYNTYVGCIEGFTAMICVIKNLKMKIVKKVKTSIASFWSGFLILCCMPLDNIVAQIPRNTPHPSQPSSIDIQSPFEIILYFILPVIAIIVFIWLKRRKARLDKEKEDSM